MQLENGIKYKKIIVSLKYLLVVCIIFLISISVYNAISNASVYGKLDFIFCDILYRQHAIAVILALVASLLRASADIKNLYYVLIIFITLISIQLFVIEPYFLEACRQQMMR